MSRLRKAPCEALQVHECAPPPGAMTVVDFVLLRPGDVLANIDVGISQIFGPVGTHAVVLDTFTNGDLCAFVQVRRFDDPNGTAETFYAGRFAIVGRVTHEAGKLYYDVLRALDP